MKIAIGCDHAGFDYKEIAIRQAKKHGYEIIDHGTHSTDSVDYPDFVHPVAKDVSKGKATFGILLCGSGNGVSMAANKHKKIRAALCWNQELAKLARQHNDANIISIPSRFISGRMASLIISAFLKTKFEGGRHKRRVDKISNC